MTTTVTRHPLWLSIGALALLAACDAGTGASSPGRSRFATRDSAGITIVENLVAEQPDIPRWRVDTTPTITIGVESGDPAQEFAQIGGVHGLPNAMMLVLNGSGESAYEFRFFDSAGRHIATHGRRGEGPGDFRWINFVGTAGGDTVIAVDFTNRRLNWVSASAGYLRSLPLDELAFKRILGDDASGTIETLVPLDDSTYATKAFRRVRTAGPPLSETLTYHLLDLRAGTATELARHPEQGTYLELTGGNVHLTPVEAETPLHVVDRARRRMCVALTSTAEVSCTALDGARRIIRWTADTVPYTAADRRANEERLRASVLRPGSRYTEGDFRTILGLRTWPERFNPVIDLQLDSEGNFWILERVRGPDASPRTRFRVLDPDGRLIAFADSFLPANVGLGSRTHIGARSVVRAFEDAEGVPKVGVFPIRKEE